MIGVELSKQVHRARGWATVAAMAVVSLAVAVIIAATNPALPERLGNWDSVVSNASGFALPLISLNAMVLFMLPLAVAIFAGESVAGEASWGSLRYVLAHPVQRSRVLASKAAVAGIFCLCAVVVAIVVPLVIGSIAYGWRGLRVVDLQHSTTLHLASATFVPAVALGRTALAAAFVTATLTSTFAFALFLSTLTKAPFSAVAGGVGLSLVSRALDNIPGLHALSPWLPATDAGTTAWTGFFTDPIQSGAAVHALLVQLVYAAMFLVAAWIWFTRSDVLS